MKNQKRSLLIVFLLVMIFALTGCGDKEKEDNKPSKIGRIVDSISGGDELGNTSSNLTNGGLIAEYEGNLYFAVRGDVYKKENDNIKKLCEIEGEFPHIGYINVLDDWIYFWGTGDKESGVYKVKTDGSEFQRIISESLDIKWNHVWVIGDRIYYADNYKVNKDGTDKIQIGEIRDTNGNTFNIVDGYMYYCDDKLEGEFKVFREKIDGTDLMEIYDGKVNDMIVDDGWIFFEGEDGLCKMKTDGSDFELLLETKVSDINVKDEWVYCAGDGIYRVKKDGTESQQLYSGEYNGFRFSIIDDWIYYLTIDTSNGEQTIYRMKIDGSKHEVFFGDEQRVEIEKTEGHEDENQEEKIVLNNTYRSQFADFNMVTFPIFEFDFPSTWNITEEVTKDNENVVISNEHGVTITFTNNLYAPVGSDAPGGSNVYMSRVEATKIDDSSFVPQRIQDSDPTYVGDFVVAKLKMTGELDMKKDTDFQEVDGRVSYAVIQESQLGEHDVRHPYSVAFGFTYGGGVSLIAEAPADGFTKEEEKAVIEILKSFKLAEQ